MGIWRAEEWQDESGYWHCNDTSNLVKGSSAWWHASRILGVTPAEFIKKLVNEYHPDKLYHSDDCSLVYWSWEKQQDMRKYKNAMNAAARSKNYTI
jgi:hypothetical protein